MERRAIGGWWALERDISPQYMRWRDIIIQNLYYESDKMFRVPVLQRNDVSCPGKELYTLGWAYDGLDRGRICFANVILTEYQIELVVRGFPEIIFDIVNCAILREKQKQ